MKPGRVIPTAEPFFFPGGLTGCLLVHGFTGTPKEMCPLGEFLAGQGYTVLGIRLTGHATDPQDMLRARWQDWLTDVEDGHSLLTGACRRLFVIGLSMGGMLALLHAARFPVAGLVCLSTMHHLPADWRLPYVNQFSRILPSIPKGPPDWYDPEAGRTHIDYPYYPTRAIGQLRDLMVAMRASLPQVTAPLLLLNSKNDNGVRPEDRHAELILEAAASRDKSYVLIEGSGHVVCRDAQKEQVFRIVNEFLKKQEITPESP